MQRRVGPETTKRSKFTWTQDGYDAWVWLTEHAHEFGVDPRRMAIGGDSAGGNITAVTGQRLAKERFPVQPKYVRQVLSHKVLIRFSLFVRN